jgi:hypothetical protein
MKFNFILKIILSVFCILCFSPLNAKAVKKSSHEAELKRIVSDIRESILKKDIDHLVQYIGPDGLECTEDQYSYAEVIAALKDKRSFLYLSLFNSKLFKKKCGQEYPDENPAISDLEFFEAAKDLNVEVSDLDPDWVDVKISSSIKSQYQRDWTFHRVKGKWKITEGILMRCSCG